MFNRDFRRARVASIALCVLFLFYTHDAFAFRLRVTPIGGTASGGQGQIGDTLVVGIDATLEEGESLVALFATLQWDLEGGSILDLVSANESLSIDINGDSLTNINDIYFFGEVGVPITSSNSYPDGNSFPDTQSGPSFLYGFELVPPVPPDFDDEYLADIIENGLPGSAEFRVGTVEFVLREAGTTTISFLTDLDVNVRTIVLGGHAEIFPNDEIVFDNFDVSSVGFTGLQILVVPEPGTALLLGFGLTFMAVRRPRR